MAYIIIILFLVGVMLALVEDYLGKYKVIIYVAMALPLILVAGLREVGMDADSINYESAYLHYNSTGTAGSMDFSFILFSSILNNISHDVHILFLFYATMGVTLKMFALSKLSDSWFMPLAVYITYYFECHEMLQIRAGVMAGFFLLAIPYIAEGRRKMATLLILIGAFFHISALVLLPIMFLNNKPIGKWEMWIWVLIVPIGYMIYFAGTSVDLTSEIPYIGDKIATYQKASEIGRDVVTIYAFSPRHIIVIALYYYLLLYGKLLVNYNKYFSLMLRIYGIGLFCYTSFTFVSPIADRLYSLFCLVSVVLYADIYYTIKPKWAGFSVFFIVALLFLNYGLAKIGFSLFFNV